LVSCVWTGGSGPGKAGFSIDGKEFVIVVDVPNNEDGSPGVMKATFDAEGMDVFGKWLSTAFGGGGGDDDDSGEQAAGSEVPSDELVDVPE